MPKIPRKAGLSLAALLLLATSALVGAPASAAAAVDLSFALADADSSCRQWRDGGDAATWNFTLAQNGTDTSSILTPTYVWVDDTGAPAMQADSWTAIMNSKGQTLVEPKAYDSGSSNELATAPGVYTPGHTTSLDIWLYSASRSPNPAPPTTVTLSITPNSNSENKDHYFNVTARTHRTGVSDITRKVPVCVHVPPKPRFDMGNMTDSLQASANSNITVSFWLKNIGNTRDFYYCNVTVPREDWTWNFTGGVNNLGNQNVTNQLNISQNITIRVKVFVPQNARARENSTVSLNCTSDTAIRIGLSLFVYPPYTRIEVIQYYYVSGKIPAGMPATLAGVPGDQLRFDFLVQNLGNGPDSGTAVMAVGNFSWDTLVTPSTFDFPPFGDPLADQPAQFLVTIPANTLIFTYDFTVNVTSVVNGTPITSLRFHVQVKQLYVPLVSPVAFKYGDPAQEVVFNFTIKNGGNGLDNLVIEVFNLTDWRVFLSPPIGKKLLQVGDEAGFQATVIVPKDLTKAQVGNYTQIIRVSSEYAQLDLGASIYMEANLTVVILPRISCALDPPDTDKELNPYSFPGGVATANFILALSNTGNGGDSDTMSATAPAGFNVTLAPSHLQLNILETKAVLVSIVAPSGILTGDYTINVLARSDARASANCTAAYRLHVFILDAALNPSISSYIQNPDKPLDEITNPVTVGEVTQVETFFVRFRVFLENHGDRAIPKDAASFVVYDTLECSRVPIGATLDTCGTRQVFNTTNQNNVITGTGGTTYFEFTFTAPEYLCFDTDVCHRTDPPPPSNAHRLRFTVTLKDEGVTTNNEAVVTVNVLPKTVLKQPEAGAPFPVAPVGAGIGAAGLVAFAYWYRFVRKPKVDEDLYASIYGAQGAPTEQSQSVDQYFATQQPAQEAPLPQQYQGMTDEQIEEARRLYGDNYGR